MRLALPELCIKKGNYNKPASDLQGRKTLTSEDCVYEVFAWRKHTKICFRKIVPVAIFFSGKIGCPHT